MTVEELGELAAESGYWMVFRTPIDPGACEDELFEVRLTRHGWDATSFDDHHVFNSTKAREACDLGEKWLREGGAK